MSIDGIASYGQTISDLLPSEDLSLMKTGCDSAGRLRRMYALMDAHFGDLHWWPADEPFEVIVGAILTQNTAWRNVTLAIAKLKEAEVLSPGGLDGIGEDRLADLIRSSGYYRVKAGRLKALVRFLKEEYGGSMDCLAAEETTTLRSKLLKVHGIGEETADSILLYACRKPVFVVDAYTRRILMRHEIIRPQASYAEVQNLFMHNLAPDVYLYNQYHALIVNTGKEFCKKKGLCPQCPLKEISSVMTGD